MTPDTVADDIQSLMAGLQIAVDFDFHIVEFYFDAVQQGVIVGGTGRDFIQRVNHFDDAVQDTLRAEPGSSLPRAALKVGRGKAFARYVPECSTALHRGSDRRSAAP